MHVTDGSEERTLHVTDGSEERTLYVTDGSEERTLHVTDGSEERTCMSQNSLNIVLLHSFGSAGCPSPTSMLYTLVYLFPVFVLPCRCDVFLPYKNMTTRDCKGG